MNEAKAKAIDHKAKVKAIDHKAKVKAINHMAKAKAIDHKAKVKAKSTFFLATRPSGLEALKSLKRPINNYSREVLWLH